MNHKKRGLTLAVLMGIFFLALTCGVALAEPATFYVKIQNATDYSIKLKWHFSTRAGENHSADQVSTISPHSTMKFQGRPGLGRMHYQFHTGGKGSPIKKHWKDGDSDPNAWKAFLVIKYDASKGVQVFKKTNADDF